jgi:hypothetical protein
LFLTITIDTEEDNWGDFQRTSFSVENIRRVSRLQELFNNRGVRPTYLISYPVATSRIGIELLGKYRADGLCEIGTHPHPWNTPPIEEERTAQNTYMGNLPVSLQYRKMKTLTDTIAANFGVAPTSYRSGKWGFSDSVAENLIRLRYLVDSSISPSWDWTEAGGPDFSNYSLDPFVYQMEATTDEQGGSLLEVPATIDFLQSPRKVASSVYWSLTRNVPLGRTIARVLSRAGVLNHLCISPETHDAAHMIKLAAALVRRGTKVINMFFHSPSLLENCSPFVRTEADVTAFLARIDRFLAFATSAGLQSVTMSELRASDVGPSHVKLLPTSSRVLSAATA